MQFQGYVCACVRDYVDIAPRRDDRMEEQLRFRIK